MASLFAGQVAAATRADPAQLCEIAAARAAAETDVPLAVLRAISLAETGRGTPPRPWPWAVNQAGNGQWFASRAEAGAAVATILAEGKTNVDLGCFQLNFRWHGAAFPSVDAMLEPEANALYAAHLLRGLYADSGDWSVAAGAYHSATPALATRYRDRFDPILAEMAGDPAPLPMATQNNFPLLKAGAVGVGASLVPQLAPRQALLIWQP